LKNIASVEMFFLFFFTSVRVVVSYRWQLCWLACG